MRKDLKVTKNAAGELVVVPDRLELPRMTQGTYLLVWTIDEEVLPNAKFADESIALQWQPPKIPEYHVFRRGRVDHDKDDKVLTILDRNQDDGTMGEFEYKLTVIESNIEGEDKQLYFKVRDELRDDGRPINNPIIINR